MQDFLQRTHHAGCAKIPPVENIILVSWQMSFAASVSWRSAI